MKRDKWTHRPVFPSGTASVSTPPAVAGDLVITPFAAANPGAVTAVSLATGREVWRGPDPARGAAVAVDAGVAFVLGKDGNFYALEAATGRERWKPLEVRRPVEGRPRAVDVLYFQGSPVAKPAAVDRGTLYALDLATREILWSFTRATAEPNWPFGHVTPVDGGLWVDSYQALVKLQ